MNLFSAEKTLTEESKETKKTQFRTPLTDLKNGSTNAVSSDEKSDKVGDGDGGGGANRRRRSGRTSDAAAVVPTPGRCIRGDSSNPKKNVELFLPEELDVVATKYGGWPLWPGIVCKAPNSDKYLTNSDVHIQFFDGNEPSRAWVRRSMTLRYVHGEGPFVQEGSKYWADNERACKQADDVCKMPRDSRLTLLVTDWSSESDDDGDEDESNERRKAKRVRRASKVDVDTRKDVDISDATYYVEGSDEAAAASQSSVDATSESSVDSAFNPVTELQPADIKRKISNDFGKYEMSEYERIREKNIEDRKRRFEELKLAELRDSLSPGGGGGAGASTKASSVSRRGLAKTAAAAAAATPSPGRTSLRLQRIDADTGMKLPDKAAAAATIEPLDEHPRFPLRTLTLAEVGFKKTTDEGGCTKDDFFEELRLDARGNQSRTTKNLSFGTNHKEVFEKLTITPERVAQVVPTRIFSMAIHPSASKLLVAAGGKWGGIGLWDVEKGGVGLWDVGNTEHQQHGVRLFTPHSRPINSMSFNPFNDRQLVTTSYDGTARVLDLEQEQIDLLYGDPSDDVYINYHGQSSAHTFVLSLGRSGLIGVVDRRAANLKRALDLQAFQRGLAAKTISVHPLQENLVLAGNVKGHVKVFDLRQSRVVGGGAAASSVCELLGATRGANSAFFSPRSGDRVVTSAYDNRIRLYDTRTMSGQLMPTKSIAHNNQTGRWLTTFKTEWHPSGRLFFCGSMSQPRQIDVFDEQQQRQIIAIKGEALCSVTSIVRCHPAMDVVVGGNSAGRVHVFM